MRAVLPLFCILAACSGEESEGSMDAKTACGLVESWLANNAVPIGAETYSDLPFGDCYDYWSVEEDRAAGVTVNTSYTDGGDFVGISLDCVLLEFDQGWRVESCLPTTGT